MIRKARGLLTLAAVTAEIISRLITGGTTEEDDAALDPRRRYSV